MKMPTDLPGDKMRKAIAEFSDLAQKHREKPRGELLEKISQKFDLSPRECDFLIRQLDNS